MNCARLPCCRSWAFRVSSTDASWWDGYEPIVDALTGYWCSCILKGVLHLAFTSSVLQGVLPCLVSCERFAPCFSWGVCCGAGVFGEPTPGTPSTLQHDPSVKKDLIFIKGSFNASAKGEGCWPKGVLVKWWNKEAPVKVSDNANSFC